MVVENGLGAYRTRRMPTERSTTATAFDYLRAHIEQMAEAVKDGVDLMATPLGLHRSGECLTGEMAKRYGFIYVNKFDDGTGDLSRERRTASTGIRRSLLPTAKI